MQRKTATGRTKIIVVRLTQKVDYQSETACEEEKQALPLSSEQFPDEVTVTGAKGYVMVTSCGFLCNCHENSSK